jgi:hypothetical protein
MGCMGSGLLATILTDINSPREGTIVRLSRGQHKSVSRRGTLNSPALY